MMRSRVGVSPSQAHNEAYQRTPEHDAMQVAVYKHLVSKHGTVLNRTVYNQSKPFVSKWVIAEYDLEINGNIIAFCDIMLICEQMRVADLKHFGDPILLYVAYEVKPRIETVGGLIRQCKVLEHHLQQAVQTGAGQASNIAEVVAVVPHDDAAMSNFRLMHAGTILSWDMKAGCPDGEQP